jgi:hypothetical protein
MNPDLQKLKKFRVRELIVNNGLLWIDLIVDLKKYKDEL